MKKLLLGFSLLISCGLHSQVLLPVNPTAYGEKKNREQVLITFYYPTICGNPSSLIIKQSAIVFDSCNNRLWIMNPKTGLWDTAHLGKVIADDVFYNIVKVTGGDSTMWSPDVTHFNFRNFKFGVTGGQLTINRPSGENSDSTTSIVLGLPNTGVTAGSYTNINGTVDAQGRLTAVSNGSSGSGTINAGAQYYIPFYSASGTAQTLSAMSGIRTNSANTFLGIGVNPSFPISVLQNTTGVYNTLMDLTVGDLTAGQKVELGFGVANSGYNKFYLHFNYVGSGSTSNSFSIIPWGGSYELLKILGDGTVTLGGTPYTGTGNKVAYFNTNGDFVRSTIDPANIETVFTETIERFTGSTSSTVTVTNTPKTSKARIAFLNGVQIDPNKVSISGSAFTISGIAREITDIITIKYSY